MAAAKKAAPTRAATFHDHIKELRTRVFAIAIVFIVAASVAYNYKDMLLALLLRPLGKEKLIFLTPGGGFSFIFQIALYGGLIVTIPVLIYNTYRFIKPVLSKRAQRSSAVVIISSLLLLACGVMFGYIYAIPAALQFLTHFADGYASASLTADSYISFFMTYTAGLGLLFQLPLILLFIHWIHPLSPKGLLKFEQYMVLIAFILAAMITPTPDLLNQTIVASPIILMYQIGVIAICVSVFRQRRAARAVAKRTEVHAVQPQRVTHRPKPVAAPPITPTVSPSQASTTPAAVLMAKRRSIDGVVISAPRRPQRMAVQVPMRPAQSTLVSPLTSTRPVRALDGVSLVFDK